MIRVTLLTLISFVAVHQPLSDVRAEQSAAFQDCDKCPVMIPLRPTRFWMGFDKGKRAERPAYWVDSLTPFAIAKTETTYDQWNACIEDGACTPPQHDRGWGEGARPIIYIDHDQISAYLSWLESKTGKAYRLPTEEEWEYAAHGGAVSPDRVRIDGAKRANCNGCTEEWDHKTSPVGSYPPNAFGIYDMLGNVMEWTSSCWTEDHAPDRVEDCERKVRRGGSWYFNQYVSTPTYRYGEFPNRVSYDVGFRVVLDL